MGLGVRGGHGGTMGALGGILGGLSSSARVLDRAAGFGGMTGARGGTCGLSAGLVVLLLLWEAGPEVKSESLDG